MGDAENALPPSKKRTAGRELSRDNPGLDDEEDAAEQETGTFQRASDQVLAGRRMVKVRRQQSTSAPSSNPFAGIRLVPPAKSSVPPAEVTTEAQAAKGEMVSGDAEGKNNKETEKDKDENDKSESKIDKHDKSEGKIDEPKADSAPDKEDTGENRDVANEAAKPEVENEQAAEGDKNENGDKKDDASENVESSAEGTPSLNSFQQLSSNQNAFTGLAGTGFSTSTFSFGIIPNDGSTLGASSAAIFGLKNDLSSPFSGIVSNGNSSLFGTPGASAITKNEGSGFPTMQEVQVETGEENEKAVFTADSVLFEYVDGGWKERGKGELKVNVSTTGTNKARLVMRARGNYRLILNASLYPDIKLTKMEKKGITFACMNSSSEGKDGLSTFALKFKDGSIVEEFHAAVTAHKGKMTTVLKTPENSPKASDD